jgi:hypothetical protein
VRAHCVGGALRTWVFVWRGGCFHAGAETISITQPFLFAMFVSTVVPGRAVGILPTRSVNRLCLYGEKVIICYQCHFKGFARVVVYSVFGVGAEIPFHQHEKPEPPITYMGI